MTHDELLQLIAEVQAHESELEHVDVKSAGQGTPERIYESLSAFANRTGGGVILFGLDERRGFEITGVADAHRLQENVSNTAASDMEPPLRPDFTVDEIQGATVVVVEVQEVDVALRPCHYKPAGLQKGSYVRVGNTNRRMTDYEVFGYVSARTQPAFDEEPIAETTIEDLDGTKLEEYLASLKRARPQATYLDGSLGEALVQLGIARVVEGDLCPTRAGLLVFGKYPQQFEPQLVITFLHYYGTKEEEKTPKGERFLDNRKFEGSIPEMVETAVKHVTASIRKASLINGLYRRDIPEYPEEAIREAVVNAVAHRDYSHHVRGSYIQLRLFANRLEVQSPGGLFGSVSVENLEDEQSTRNHTLMRLMEDLHLVENRGSGIQAMIEAMREANLEPPQFRDKHSSFWVTFRNHSLMSPENIQWLNKFADQPLTDQQRLGLVYLRCNKRMTNSDYRRLNRVDTVAANRDLRSLVGAGFADQHSTKRWAYYTLAARTEREKVSKAVESDEQRILAYVHKHGSINNSQCRELLGVERERAKRLLGKMHEAGVLDQKGTKRGAHYVLP